VSFILNALDLPTELLNVQDSYWVAEREWEELKKAYRLVTEDMLKRLASTEDGK